MKRTLKTLLLLFLAFCAGTDSYADDYGYPQLLTKEQLLADRNLLGGVYCAYPSERPTMTVAPDGYTPFYISHYGRHGSRYQPNDSRYANTRQRLRDAHSRGVLTALGESVLGRIETLCDSCLGHGGMLTALGARQHEAIARRMYRNFPEVFRKGGSISARASVVTRCGQSMRAFVHGLNEEKQSEGGKTLDISTETDSAYMSYIAYDTPAMRKLSSKKAGWQKAYNNFMHQNVNPEPIIKRLYTDASGIDTLQTVIDLYWLTVGMQNLDLTFTLDDVFTREELLACWQCVNYRMYVCNANSPISDNIPARSASTLLRNIVETADTCITNDMPAADCRPIATLRFGHDSNLLRLLALMHIHNSSNKTDVNKAWLVWQESVLSPMAANLQIVFYRKARPCAADDAVLVKVMLNEHEVTIDTNVVKPVTSCYYRWSELREFFLSQLDNDNAKTEFIEPVQ